MRSSGKSGFRLSLVVSTILVFSSTSVHAYENYSDYLAALKIADRYVQKKKTAATSRMGALSTSAVTELFGRYYQVGDSWDIAAVRVDPNMAPGADGDKIGAPAVFHYHVTRVTTGLSPEIEIHVTQVEQFAAKIIDPKVKEIVLILNDKLKEHSKKYVMNGSDQQVVGSVDGMGGNFSGLEFFPLDILDLTTADKSQPTVQPEVPASLAKITAQTGTKIDLSQSHVFDQEDFFGRSVQALWQMGDPWPAFMKTPHGIAVLIKKGT